jgi:hypothetical protein
MSNLMIFTLGFLAGGCTGFLLAALFNTARQN